MPQYPKFQAKVRNQIVDPIMQQQQTPGYAVVLTFDKITNTCDVVTAMPGSDEMGEVYTNVPVPHTAGVQQAAPKVGVMCWLAFRDGTRGDPFITHFFDLAYSKNTFQRQNRAVMETPRFMISM